MSEEFEAFWSLYPRKVSKRYAGKAWSRLTMDERDKALEALPKHIEMWKDKAFIPYPATWLNGARWEDELTDIRPERLAVVEKAWWTSDEGTLQYGRTKGISARPGESMSAYRARLKAA